MKYSQLRVGQTLIADGGFTCMKEGAECLVKKNKGGLYVPCNEGKHYLAGQHGENDELIGLTLKRSKLS